MEYTIKRGQQFWSPSHFQLFGNFTKLVWVIEPTWTMQFDYEYRKGEEVLRDNDWQDWKKAGGISLVNWRNVRNIWDKNNDSIQCGWRWNPDLRVMEFCLYVNEDGKNIPYDRADQLVRVPPKIEEVDGVMQPTGRFELVVFEIEKLASDKYGCWLHGVNEPREKLNRIIVNTRNKFNLYSRINLYYGGRNNSKGPWGGKAPRDMNMFVDFLRK